MAITYNKAVTFTRPRQESPNWSGNIKTELSTLSDGKIRVKGTVTITNPSSYASWDYSGGSYTPGIRLVWIYQNASGSGNTTITLGTWTKAKLNGGENISFSFQTDITHSTATMTGYLQAQVTSHTDASYPWFFHTKNYDGYYPATISKYTVTINPEGGSFGGSTSNTVIHVTKGTSDWHDLTSVAANSAKTGYTFAGLYTAASGGTQVYSASGIGVNGTSYWDSSSHWAYSGDVTLHAHWTPKSYTNSISHWLLGFKNGEGNNGDHNAYRIHDDTSITGTYGTNLTLNAGWSTTLPNGCYLGVIGTASVTGSWVNYPLDSTVAQKPNAMAFQCTYYPTDYNITYTMNGGTNNSSNPSTYNVLYGVTFATPARTGYTFNGWTIGGTSVTGINPGANATFSSASDLYSKLSSRTTGNKTVVANWTAIVSTVTLNKNGGSGGTSSVNIAYDTAVGSYPSITLPTRAGYTFAGYYDVETGGTQYYNASGHSVRTWNKVGNTTLYAHWTMNQQLHIKINNTWHTGAAWIKVNGTWKKASAVWIKVNGTWKQITKL